MKIVALYARVSTTGQEKEQTIDSQIAEIETKIKSDGNLLGDKLRFIDDGWSGELLARPALDELRDAIKNKAFGALYIYDLGRLSRTFLNQLILKNEIQQTGIQLISLHDINADNPEQSFAQNVMGLFHDYERIKIAERMRRGKQYKAKKGILFGWEAPYGYRYNKESNTFSIIPEEAEVVKKIYTWVGVEALTVRQVIRRLYELKITPRKSLNEYWSTSTVCKRLKDETYTGTTYYNKTYSKVPIKPFNQEKYKRNKKTSRSFKNRDEWYPISVPVIIDKELFEATQIQIDKNRLLAVRNRKNDYLLSGIIHCSCGCTRAGEGISHTTNLYYRCTDRVKRFPLPKQCHSKGVNSVVLDRVVWDKVSSLLSTPSLVKEQYKKWVSKQSGAIKRVPTTTVSTEASIKKLEEQENRYLKAYGEGIISLEQYKDKLNDLKVKKAQLINTEVALTDYQEAKKKLIQLPKLDDICGKMSTVLKDLPFDKKQFIARKVIADVITDGKEATIRGYIPLQLSQNLEKNIKYEIEYRNRWSAKCG